MLESQSDRLALSVFGAARAAVGAHEVRLRSRKSRAVLAYLALNDSGQETRERLVGLLWSESGEEKARANLRQVLHELRSALEQAGYTGLRAERQTLELERGSFAVDLQDVLLSAEHHHAHDLVLDQPRIADTLLQDFEDLDPAFRVWLLAKRQTVQDRLVRNLETGLRDERIDRTERRRLAEALMSLDPTHEEACRLLMRTRAEEGDVGTALKAYAALWHVLEEEYDQEPSAATQQLVSEIKQGLFDAPPAPAATVPAPAARALSPPAQARQTMADVGIGDVVIPAPAPVPPGPTAPTFIRMALQVEPFGINGVSADRAHLVEGFRHHLIACLVRFREWYVTDGPVEPEPDSTRHGVSARYAVGATAYQAGNAINLVLTLRELDGGIFVWSDRFELTLDNWFEAQQRIVRRIAMSLNVQLSTERLMRLAYEPDVSLQVYDKWLRGQALI
ncbi:MAG TPA: BTAD domain-containing putative transcriptional regulator, partial [Acetobacteraceae bacterium]